MIKLTTKELVLAALFIAIVFLATAFLRIPSPFLTGAGQIHTGTAVVFIISVVYGPKMGAVSSLGMVLFNVIFPLAMWAPINLVARPVMALIFGHIAHFRGAGGKKVWLNAMAAVAGGLWLIPAMYVGELLMFRLHFAAPLVGVPGNFMQIVLALVLGLPLIAIIKSHKPKL